MEILRIIKNLRIALDKPVDEREGYRAIRRAALAIAALMAPDR